MRRLILALCLVASLCAYQLSPSNLVIDTFEFRNIPAKYNLGKNLKIPVEDPLRAIPKLQKKLSSAGTEAVLNDYADDVLASIQKFMVSGDLDPLAVPDVHVGFNYTLIIVYHGNLDMTNGLLADLSTIHRGGDVIATYSTEAKYLEVTLPIAFNDMRFSYDYSVDIMGLGLTGSIEGIARNVALEVRIGFSPETIHLSLDEFVITHAGNIDVAFHGDIWLDWLLDILGFLVTDVLKEALLLVLDGVVGDGLKSVIDDVNQAIDDFWNPTTPVPVTTVGLFLR